MDTAEKLELLKIAEKLAHLSSSDRVVETIRIFDILISKIDSNGSIIDSNEPEIQADTPKPRGRPPKVK